MTDLARNSKLIGAIGTQLEEFGAMSFETSRRHSGGWVKEAKSNKRAIIEGANARNGRPSAKGKFWELRTKTTKPPGVTLVDMVLYEELSEKNRARGDKQKKRKRGEAQGRADG